MATRNPAINSPVDIEKLSHGFIGFHICKRWLVSRISPINSIKGNYPPGTNDQVTLEDDFPVSQVGYVSSLVGHAMGADVKIAWSKWIADQSLRRWFGKGSSGKFGFGATSPDRTCH